MFYMGYSPENGFSGAWDHCAEQLMVYVLAPVVWATGAQCGTRLFQAEFMQ